MTNVIIIIVTIYYYMYAIKMQRWPLLVKVLQGFVM